MKNDDKRLGEIYFEGSTNKISWKGFPSKLPVKGWEIEERYFLTYQETVAQRVHKCVQEFVPIKWYMDIYIHVSPCHSSS